MRQIAMASARRAILKSATTQSQLLQLLTRRAISSSAVLSSSAANFHASHHRQPTSRSVGPDFYALLELHRHKINEADIKQAYYRLARQYHPDQLIHLSESDRSRAEKKFAAISVAYKVLSDPVQRQQYDTFVDLSSIGDQDRMLHWVNWKNNRLLAAQVKINRPPDQLGFEGFTPAYEKGYEKKDEAQTAGAASKPAAQSTPAKPKVQMPIFRSS